MTYVALLWHMHQPYYEDLATGEHVLPWVRMHALKDYYGMVALMREFPGVKLTFNLVPSLLVQLEAFADDRARDWHLELGMKPAAELTDAERTTALAEFFHAPRGRMIDPYPRYAELLRKRDAGSAYGDQDFLDLQVWHKLAWVDPSYLEGDVRVRRLIAKGRSFTEDDKRELRAIELELIRRAIPEYREAAQRGQIELSTSPFYHPILPLLCDTDVYLRTHPSAAVPRPAFRHPEDAKEQLMRARQCHLRLFGHEPVGVWPSEGSVSDAAAELALHRILCRLVLHRHRRALEIQRHRVAEELDVRQFLRCRRHQQIAVLDRAPGAHRLEEVLHRDPDLTFDAANRLLQHLGEKRVRFLDPDLVL